MKIVKDKFHKKEFFNVALRTGLFLIVFASLVWIFTFRFSQGCSAELREGDIAPRDIFAPFDFTYYGETDEKATGELKEKAAKAVKFVYDFDEDARRIFFSYVNSFFSVLGSLAEDNITPEEKIAKLKIEFPDLKESQALIQLSKEELDNIKTEVTEITNQIESSPIIVKSEWQAIKQKLAEVVLRDLKAKSENVFNVNEFVVLEGAQNTLISNLVNKYFKENNKLKSAVTELLQDKIAPNIKENPDEYLKRKREAIANVPEVLKEIEVKKNEIILGKGEKIKRHHVRQMEKILGKESGERKSASSSVSMAIIILLLLSLTVVSIKRYELKIYNNNLDLLLIAVIAIIFLIGVRLITVSFLSSYFIPIASASMLIAILLNENIAFLITLMLCIGCGILVGNRLDMMIICLTGGVVGIYAVRNLRKRFQLLRAGSLVGCANFVMIASFGILTNLEPKIFLEEAGKGFLNGIISSFIVMGLLPVFESLFKITTDITLLELSDLNQPILKELTLKAAGTYHHSLLVGNLAEAACDSIVANPLLARVGAYYHDIGKIEKPEYFSENVIENSSLHDKLSPPMSALIITNHVRDGVELAKKYKLNQAIIDFIQQHHGNTLIYYFYQRALEKVADENELKEEDFRYPGPKPQTKEVAIVLLADAVEASSRTLSNPTPARIEGLVRKIINNKFIDGQLDECELTLKDLNKIADSFVRILTGVFHSRVEYPERRRADYLE